MDQPVSRRPPRFRHGPTAQTTRQHLTYGATARGGSPPGAWHTPAGWSLRIPNAAARWPNKFRDGRNSEAGTHALLLQAPFDVEYDGGFTGLWDQDGRCTPPPFRPNGILSGLG